VARIDSTFPVTFDYKDRVVAADGKELAVLRAVTNRELRFTPRATPLLRMLIVAADYACFRAFFESSSEPP
jgi:hypothetical protein